MDGFEGNNGVIILAATNRPESLDPALTAPRPFRPPRSRGAARPAGPRGHPQAFTPKKIKTEPRCRLSARSRVWHPAHPARNWRTSSTKPPCAPSATTGPPRLRRTWRKPSRSLSRAIRRRTRYLTDQEKSIVSYHEIGHALVAALQTPLRARAENHHRAAHVRRARLHDAGR